MRATLYEESPRRHSKSTFNVRVCARVEKHIDELSLTTTRRGTSLSNKKSKVADVMELTVQECYREFSEELLAEYHANVQMMEDQRRELEAAKEQSEAAARVASSLEQPVRGERLASHV